jgi:hypothetical protein
MTAASPYLRLLWKEYRVARPFWLSLVGLTVALDCLIVALVSDGQARAQGISVMLFGAPLFFALGCAGAAFAIEKEEGTFNFLQAIPVRAGHLLAGKLSLILGGTLAMALLLWGIAIVCTRHLLRLDFEGQLNFAGMSILGAIAWGLLFSLLFSRPLLAITLGAAAACAVPTVLSRNLHNQQVSGGSSLIALAVLGADIYLALRWLHSDIPLHVPKQVSSSLPTLTQAIAAAPTEGRLISAARPDRNAILNRLTWQTWRQSWPAMAALFVLASAIAFWITASTPTNTREHYWSYLRGAHLAVAAIMGFVAALGGTFTFQSDQAARRYRFFAEHSVPPRAVWRSRQLPWICMLVVSMLAIYVSLVGPRGLLDINRTETLVAQPRDPTLPGFNYVGFVIACTALCYAAGQWCSMFIRSGVVAGSFAVVFSALLCAWTVLMHFLHASWLWSVAPIPLVLLWATWLRAPDWILEQTNWSARTKAAAAFLLPAGILLVSVAAYRVFSIPDVSPGFDRAAYLAKIAATKEHPGDVYRQILGHLTSISWEEGSIDPIEVTNGHLKQAQKRWLQDNSEEVQDLFDNVKSGACVWQDPKSPVFGGGSYQLAALAIFAARQSMVEERLDEALARYIDGLRLISQLSEYLPPREAEFTGRLAEVMLRDLTWWGAARSQTPARIRNAIEKLQEFEPDSMHFLEQLKFQYVVERRRIDGDEDALRLAYGFRPGTEIATSLHVALDKLLPWERFRARRQLNVLTTNGLEQLKSMQQCLESEGPLTTLLPPRWQPTPERFDYFNVLQTSFDEVLFNAKVQLADFEATRRATMVILALEGHRLQSGRLPPVLDNLSEIFLGKIPIDPYSGQPFVYFPKGIPEPTTELERVEFQSPHAEYGLYHQPKKEFGQPCLWCTSPNLRVLLWPQRPQPVSAAIRRKEPPPVYFYTSRTDDKPLPTYSAWGAGYWFPIPSTPPEKFEIPKSKAQTHDIAAQRLRASAVK